jgi:ribose transport system permease protein
MPQEPSISPLERPAVAEQTSITVVGRAWAPRVGKRVLGRVRLYAGALTALVILCVYLTVTQQFFLTKANILDMLASNSDLMLVSIGMTFAVLSAGFDLSVGSIVAASGLAAYGVAAAHLSPVLVILATIGLGIGIGALVNGMLIGGFRLNFFVVTLGSMTLISGLTAVLTNGQTKLITSGGVFAAIGNGSALGVPVPVWICLAALVLAAAVLHYTPFGRAVYAVGGNREAARLAGINVTLVIILVYAITGMSGALAGLVDASRLASASPTSGSSLALTAGAAVLLGGTSFFGGIGGVGGTIVGVLLISVLQNGLGLMGVSSFWQGVVTGAVLIAAVIIDRLQTPASKRR